MRDQNGEGQGMMNEMTEEPEAILADDWRFKEKLGLGEGAYELLKQANNLERMLGVAGAASGGAFIASSTVVATTFYHEYRERKSHAVRELESEFKRV